MEPLSDVLPRLLSRKGRLVPTAPDDPEEIERYLLERALLPTAAYQALISHARKRLADTNGHALDDTERRYTTSDVARLERDYELAQLRDRLLATRPPGCFCYGLGGLRRRWIPMPGDAEPESVWEVWCTCPEAVEQQANTERLLAERRRAHLQKSADRLFGSLAERFRPWSFQTLLDLSPGHHAVVELVRPWRTDPDRWGLVLRGPTGVGKTGIGVSILDDAVRGGQTALYVDVSDMLADLIDSYGRGRAGAEAFAESGGNPHWHALFTIEVLLIDDLGAERHKATEDVDWATEQLWRLIGNRHRNKRKTIVTTNHSLAELTRMFGHARIASRLQEDSLVIDCSNLPMLRQP